MQTQNLEYNLNQPIPKQIAVPLNSLYGISVKLYKDGEALSCGMDELTVDGLAAVSQVADYNIYTLSSDGNVGIKKYDVVLNKDGLQANFHLHVMQQDFGYFEQ